MPEPGLDSKVALIDISASRIFLVGVAWIDSNHRHADTLDLILHVERRSRSFAGVGSSLRLAISFIISNYRKYFDESSIGISSAA
jgi:hypothetical protein